MESPDSVILFAVILFAAFTQGLAGFGMGLVAMPLLVWIVDIRTAAPLVALTLLTTIIFTLIRHRRHFDLRAVVPMWVSSLIGIQIGVMAVKYLDERFTLTVLGFVIAGYALYALLNLRLPELRSRAWGLGFGLVGGLLSGAYNSSGPAAIAYAQCRRWPPPEFKSNLQGFFIINTITTSTTHAISQNITPAVWKGYLVSLPAIGLGLLAAFGLERHLNPDRFRLAVLWLLLLLGVQRIV